MLREDVSVEEGQGICLSLRAGTWDSAGTRIVPCGGVFFGTPTRCSLPPMDSQEQGSCQPVQDRVCPAPTGPCALTGAADPALRFCSPTSESNLNDSRSESWSG